MLRIHKKTLPTIAKRMQAALMALILMLGLAGCSNAKQPDNPDSGDPSQVADANSSPAEVWYAPGTQKIRPDVEAKEYADVQMDELQVRTGRLEYESAQIIMSALRDIKSYELAISDLTLKGDPTVTYSAENIQVFNQKYITVTKVTEGSPLSTPGLYPDALVPFEAAKSYEENKAEKGSNQGIWVTFYAPKGQQAGEYTGTFTLDMDGYKQEIPVSLKIWDIDFAENYTAKSCFLIDWTSFSYAELDSSQDMYDAYAKALLEYRLQPELLMNDFLKSDTEDMEYYAAKALELAQDPRCNVVFMPFETDNGRGDTYLVIESTKNWIRSFVEASFASFGTEKQMNLVEKTMTYFTFIDEPTMNPNLIPRVNRAMQDFTALRTEVKEEYLEKLKETEGLSDEEYEFRLEVINAIEKIRNILTGPHDSRMEGVEVYCPQVDLYDSEQNRAEYVNDVERWWYTAVGPRYPYPTYHIDDTNLLSARLLSWMQADYDVVGNLYWATNIYCAYITEEFLENPYEYAMRYTEAGGSNGDGFLFYPGKRYGINGPIGSIRLHAIRDGMEEYETLRGIEKIYKEIDNALNNGNNSAHACVSFEDVYTRMSENLYSGTSVYTTQAYFDAARELLGNLAELASLGGAVSSISLEDGKTVVQLVLPDGYTVSYEASEGRIQNETKPAEGYTLYTFTQPLAESRNVFECTVSDGNKTIALNLYLGGAIHTYAAEDLAEGTFVGVRQMAQLTAEDKVAANILDPSLTAQSYWMQLKLPEADAQLRHSLVLNDAELLSRIGATTQKMVIKIYNNRDTAGEDEGRYTYRLQFKYKNNEYYTEIRQDSLKAGYNEITIGNLFGYAWEETGALTDIRLFFGEPNAEAVDDLYFIGVDVYSE